MPHGAEGDEQNLRTANETSSIKKEMSGRRGEVAEQLEFFPVQSPCRGFVSLMNVATAGVHAQPRRRFNWQKMNDAQKQEVLRLCRQRLLRKLRAAKQDSAEEPQQPSLF